MFKFEEKILLQQIKRGNQTAFSRLYDRYQDKIYRFIFFRVSNESLAQDLTSETFIKILQYLINGKEVENFQSFAYQVAKNLVIDFYRSRGQEEMPLDESISENVSDEDVDEMLDEKFNLNQIESALGQVSNPYRDVLVLRFIEDLPFKEIAKTLNIKEDNARMLAHRGLKMLRDKLGAPAK
ncbi:MAG: RNA polymerase sigma factor [Patescibacteria group bacterium]|nr:RNA polymerase sigma factor [Patescibacteria group bacterium]MDD5121358.1 RNA polymerase sigma factor [Patescibacteria group bacterium]MDD5222070.1 RNA polymerase sigma factor [Patescibacteria group bacterium]MDD5395723.1 RNA polymerase sigma factor [Patescibacteria group bacterium]